MLFSVIWPDLCVWIPVLLGGALLQETQRCPIQKSPWVVVSVLRKYLNAGLSNIEPCCVSRHYLLLPLAIDLLIPFLILLLHCFFIYSTILHSRKLSRSVLVDLRWLHPTASLLGNLDCFTFKVCSKLSVLSLLTSNPDLRLDHYNICVATLFHHHPFSLQ